MNRLVLLSHRRTELPRLSVLLSADSPATEFRLFKAGWNATEKGDFLFDDKAAESVLAKQEAHGVDRMIDLEHLSLDEDSPAFDPDARGWCRLEVRPGPELWAVDVRWTSDGLSRLKDRRQRYISPAFTVDSENRVTKVINIALTAMPATHGTPALIAAGQRTKPMDPKKLAAAIVSLRALGVSDEEILTKLAIDIKTLQSVVKAMGGDPSGDLGTLMSTVAKFAEDLAAMAAGKPTPGAEPQSPSEPATDPAMNATTIRELTERVNRLTAAESELVELKRKAAEEKAASELAERRTLVGELVKLGRETPATAWSDSAGTTPRGSLGSMPLQELRDKVAAFRSAPALVALGGAPKPPSGPSVESLEGIQISDFEIQRLRRRAEDNGVKPDLAIERYAEIKRQQLSGAEARGDSRKAKMVSRALQECDVITNAVGRISHSNLVSLSTPVKPIEEFGASSQRALEEFRLEYNTALASQPQVWAETLGTVLPGGGLKDTYPISFAVSKYTKKVAQNAPARTANVKEVSVTKELYHEAEQVELIRLVKGDFAYIKSWQEKAARMARARQFLRNQLVAALLEANGNWVDGVAFFATSHKVDPFDSSRTFRGSATWSNLQDGAAAPLSAANLTQEKALFLYSTPGPDGEELSHEADGILHPTILNEVAKNLLTVQDLILETATATAPTRNPHFQSGMGQTRAPELTGTASTANWYLYSRAAIASGLVPWVLGEDQSEEVRTWDEASDFYKDSGFIKYESLIYIGAALIYPHGIRKVQGT